MNDTILREQYISTSPNPVSIKGTEKILEQMKKSICKIHKIGGIKGTGFFCKIPYNSNLLTVLITNNHILNKNDIKEGQKIVISINNDTETKTIKIDSERVTFTCAELDVTIIEIKPISDYINYFLELDDKINENEEILSNYYDKHSIYILHYQKGEQVLVSYGLLNRINEKVIYHTCNTEQGSSGSPILSLNTFKVIGVHYGYSSFNLNKAVLIKYAIIKLNQQKKMSNEKIIALKIIKKEFNDLISNPITNIGLTVSLPNRNNYFEWRCSIMGARDTSYKGGVFFFKILFPDNFPISGPKIYYITPIYHVNVNPKKNNQNLKGYEDLGHICISTLNWWKPDYTMREVLTNLFALFYLGNPDSPYVLDRANEFKYNRTLYEEKIKFFTQKYARPNIEVKEYDTDCDFTYNK